MQLMWNKFIRFSNGLLLDPLSSNGSRMQGVHDFSKCIGQILLLNWLKNFFEHGKCKRMDTLLLVLEIGQFLLTNASFAQIIIIAKVRGINKDSTLPCHIRCNIYHHYFCGFNATYVWSRVHHSWCTCKCIYNFKAKHCTLSFESATTLCH